MNCKAVGSIVSFVRHHAHSVSIGAVVFVAIIASKPCAAQAVLLTVGPHGTYPTIQSALAGVVSGGTNYVFIESGTYVENVVVTGGTVFINGGELHFSGGWDSNFVLQTADPSLTVIDGNGAGRCVGISLTNNTNTTISLSNLTLNGGMASTGGGLRFSTDGRVRLDVYDCVITGNTATVTLGSPNGGGVFADVSGLGSGLTIRDTSIDHNLAWFNGSGGAVYGGGAYLEVADFAPIVIERVAFSSNQVQADSEIRGAGLYLRVNDGAVGQVEDSQFVNNQAVSTAGPQVTGTGLEVSAFGSAWVRLRRNTLYINDSPTGFGQQLHLSAYGTADFEAGDTVVAGGDEGVFASARDTATLRLTNLTVVDNVGEGLRFRVADPTPTASLHNSILYGNSSDLVLTGTGTVTESHNLVGVDPVFVNPLGFNYRLSAGSPAENAGTNSPPAGVGDADCDGAIRVIDDTVDQGAYEGIDVLFSDGFALGTRRWSRVEGG
jgi:hypothetical protein